MYVAFSALTALKEKVLAPRESSPRGGPPVPPLVVGGCMDRADAGKIYVWEITPTVDLRVADLTGKHADTHFGVTNELSNASGNYMTSQKWAAAFFFEGFDGIHYKSRFDARRTANSMALATFNATSGATDGPFSALGKHPAAMTEFASRMGITLLDPPRAPKTTVGI